MAMGPVTREHLIEILRAPGLDLAFAGWIEKGALPDAAGRATALAHRLREVPVEIDRSGGLLLEGLSSLVRDRLDEAWMPRALERILQSVHWLGAGTTRRDLVRRFIALLDRTQLGSPSAREMHVALATERPSHAAALRAMGEGAAAVSALRQAALAIESGAATLGCESHPATIAEFAREMERAAQSSAVGSGRPGARACAVRIARPGELCGLSCDLLLVTGLQADAYGAFDQAARLLGERLRADLPAPCQPPSARDIELARRAELAWALAGAERIILTWSAGDADEPDIPHPLLLRARAEGVQERQEPASRAGRAACRTDPRSAEIVMLACGARPPPEVAERVRIERERTAFFFDPRRPAGAFTGRMALVEHAARMHLRAAVGGDRPERPIAVTAIERAAGCAFAGYARRVLRLRRSEDQLEAADHRERGNLVHKAAWAAFDAARDAGGPQKPRQALLAAKTAADNALGLSGRISPLRREALTLAIADALALVARWLERQEPLSFFLAERRFGKDDPSPWQALQIPPLAENEPSIYVEGQIDRIDRTTDGRSARVIDYKTGKVPSDNDHGHLALQLPLYAAVAARALGTDDIRAQYFSIKLRGAIEEWPSGPEKQCEIAARRIEAADTARRVVLGLWSGEIEPRPERSSLCIRCDARDVCRRPAVVPEESPED
jgi:RecB family exonuclease